jgi:hypothetical protein
VIGLDTNVLLRFLLRDDEKQWEAANKVIKELKAAGKTFYLVSDKTPDLSEGWKRTRLLSFVFTGEN